MAKPSFESYFRLNAILLKISGLLPLESKWLKSVNLMIVSLALFSPLFLVLPAFYGARYHWQEIDKEELTNMISINEEILFAFFKVGVMIPKRKSLGKLLRFCKNAWDSSDETNEFQVIEPIVRQGRYLSYSFAGALCVILSSFIAMPFFDKFVYDNNGTVVHSKQMLCPTGIVHQNEVIFYIWYAIEVPLSIFAVSTMLGIDLAVAVFVLHAAAHVKLVGFRLGSIAKSDNSDERAGIYDHGMRTHRNHLDTRRKLHACISFHQEIHRYCEELEDVFNPVLLFATLLGMTVVAIDGFNIFTESGASLNYIAHLIGALVQLLVFCWPSQTLINESIALSEAVYALPWTSWPPEDRKSVCILLIRTQKAATVTAGKFTVVSILTFSEIVAKAMSFFTVLRATV